MCPEELETAGSSEDAMKELVEENRGLRHISAVTIGEGTTVEDSQEEKKKAKQQQEVRLSTKFKV